MKRKGSAHTATLTTTQTYVLFLKVTREIAIS